MKISGDVLAAGLVLGGRYRLLAPIGAGGMAVVWQAHDNVLDRAVAVKLVTPSQAGDTGPRDRIRYEARAAAALSHPNIAQVHDYGEMSSAGRVFPYVVMELVPGGTLLARLKAGPLAPRFAMRIGAEIAAALAAAHAEGLVHRDIKPGNVMLAPTGAKVVDFGIAAAVTPAGAPPREIDPGDELLGTPAYLAPERLVGDAVVPASDVYALGVVLYRMLTGCSPWSSEDTRQMLEAHLYVPPAPLRPLAEVPASVVELCNRCLSKDPALRPGAEEAAEVLALGAGVRVVTDEPHPRAGAGAEPSVLVRPAKRPRATPKRSGPAAGGAQSRRKRAAVRIAAATVLLLGAGAGAWVLWEGPERAGADGRAVAGASPGAPLPPSVAGAGVPSGGATAPAAGPVPAPAGSAPKRAGSPTVRPAATATVPGGAVPGATVPGGGTVPDPTTTAPTAAPTSAPAATEPAATERTLSSAGGSVVATCPTAGTARLLSWTATKPYKVQSAEAGPAVAPAVTFKHGNKLVTMTVTCSGGVPSAAVT